MIVVSAARATGIVVGCDDESVIGVAVAERVIDRVQLPAVFTFMTAR